MSTAIVNGTDDNFQSEVIDADTLVLVDFWAEWCGPCKMVAPLLEELVDKYEGRLKIVKIDVDANKELPGKYGVRGIPTLVLFKDGNVKEQSVGALSRSQLSAFVDKHI